MSLIQELKHLQELELKCYQINCVKLFFLTYGDGLSNINLKKLINFHKKIKK